MVVNGREIELSEEMSLSEFLKREGYDVKRVAVEVNGDVVSRVKFESCILCNGDRIEIVSFVGGG